MSLGCVVPLKQNHPLLHFLFSWKLLLRNWQMVHLSLSVSSSLSLQANISSVLSCCLWDCSTHSSLINGLPGWRLVLAPPPALREKMKTHSWICYKSSVLNLALQLWHILEGKVARLSQTRRGCPLLGFPPHQCQACMLRNKSHFKLVWNFTGQEEEL